MALLVAFGVRHFVVAPFHVPSASMEPTLAPGEIVLVDRTTRGQAQRGDVVVFDGSGYFSSIQDGGGASRYWVKRVIGVGGDTVQCCSDAGLLLVNGEEVQEDYLNDPLPASAEEFSVTVPEGRLFLLGDNRGASGDSRQHLGDPGGGMVPVHRVQGHVRWVAWPLSSAREIGPYNGEDD